VNSTATTNWGYQATAGAAAQIRWSTTATAFGSDHALAVIKPMPSNPVVNHPKGIRLRPPEDSN